MVRRLLAGGSGGAFTTSPVSGPPDDATWLRAVAYNPVLSPAAPELWSYLSVDNPTVLYVNGAWHGWFAGGGNEGAFMGAMDSSNGLAWSRNGGEAENVPVLGGFHGGINGSIYQPNVHVFDGTYYAYYNDPANSYGLSVATSADGLAWSVAATYHMLVEGRHGSIWEMYYATSSALTSGWSLGNGGAPLTDLQIAVGGMYGGPNLTVMSDGLVHCYYHACPSAGALPTNIYAATATTSDLTNWTPSATSPILTHSGVGFEVEQLADPSVLLVDGIWHMFIGAVEDQSPFTAHLLLATAAAT